jgi:hypothetical protein
MKRILLGLAMVSSLALMAAQANAAALIECGKSYAFSLHGTEPELTNDQPLHYIVGIGAISFNAAGTSGPTGCTVSHLDTFYNDNTSPTAGIGTFTGAAADCYAGSSALGGGIGCFDGGNHQNTTGTLTPSADGNGAATLAIDPSFNYTDGTPSSSHMPLTFTVQNNAGGAIVLGNSVSETAGPTTTNKAEGPVLVITMQKQSTTATLPVTGANPTACGSLGCTGTGSSTDNGYGIAPYLGLSISLFEGYGSPSSNPFQTPGVTGSFGSSLSALQIFADGLAGGSVSFSSNDSVGNTGGTAGVNGDCDTSVVQTGNFADGTSNDAASIIHSTPTCADAAAGAAFQLSAVQWGPTDTEDYVIVTGLTDTPDLGGALVPAGIMSVAQGLPSAPPGFFHSNNTAAINLNAVTTAPVSKAITLTDTSPAGCDATFTFVPTHTDPQCAVSLSTTSAAVEGDNPTAVPGTSVVCTCTLTEAAAPTTGTFTVTSSDCDLSVGNATETVSCQN